MGKIGFLALLIIILAASSWFHWPWIPLSSFLLNDKLHIPEVLNLVLSTSLGALTAFLLVLLVEWLRGSNVEINKIEPLSIDSRKLLKIGVVVKARRLGELIKLAPYVHSFATLTVYINHDAKSQYRVKWDNAPEPWEYDSRLHQDIIFSGSYLKNKTQVPLQLNGVLTGTTHGFPRLNLLPQAMQTENLVPDDQATASILAKNVGDTDFLIYDPEYYFNKKENHCSKKKAYLKIVFKSSLTRKEEYFKVSNPSDRLESFDLKKISKSDFFSKID